MFPRSAWEDNLIRPGNWYVWSSGTSIKVRADPWLLIWMKGLGFNVRLEGWPDVLISKPTQQPQGPLWDLRQLWRGGCENDPLIYMYIGVMLRMVDGLGWSTEGLRVGEGLLIVVRPAPTSLRLCSPFAKRSSSQSGSNRVGNSLTEQEPCAKESAVSVGAS